MAAHFNTGINALSCSQAGRAEVPWTLVGLGRGKPSATGCVRCAAIVNPQAERIKTRRDPPQQADKPEPRTCIARIPSSVTQHSPKDREHEAGRYEPRRWPLPVHDFADAWFAG
jgi:hypothetical protein